MTKNELAQTISELNEDEFMLLKLLVFIDKLGINKEYPFDKWFDALTKKFGKDDLTIHNCINRLIYLCLIGIQDKVGIIAIQRYNYDDNAITEFQYKTRPIDLEIIN